MAYTYLPLPKKRSFTLITAAVLFVLVYVSHTSPLLSQQEPAQNNRRGKPARSSACLIKGGKIVTMAGREYTSGSVLIVSGKIRAVDDQIKAPRGARIIDASGKTVIPGLIDANSCSLLTSASNTKRIDSDVLDLFDPFEAEEIELIVAQGVTSIALSPPAGSGFSGRVSVVKLVPGADTGQMVLKEDAALKAGVGVGFLGKPFARLKTIASMEKAFKDAKSYEEAWEMYREELKKYEDSLEKEEKKEPEEEKGPQKGEDEESKGDEKKGKEKGKDEGRRGKEKEKKKENGNALLLADAESGDEKGKKGESKEDKEKPEKPEKPKRPSYDIKKEYLLKAMQGDMAFMCEVHRAADILKVIDMGHEYHLDLVLVGCTEGHLVAGEIKKAGVPVILGAVQRPVEKEMNEFFFHDPACAAKMVEKEVRIAIAGSGRSSRETRFLAINAACAAGAGLAPQKALESITASPARILRLDDRIGTIEKGKDADIVILSGDPLKSGTTVDLVIIDGKVVYER